MSQKSEEIKFRVEPLKKLAAVEIATDEGLALSDICRRALGEYLDKRTQKRQSRQYVTV